MTAPTRAALDRWLAALTGKRVFVVGDLIADRYVFAAPARLSREAPVIIATEERESLIPGGAANALNNLRDLGVDARPFGVVGDDDDGRELLDCLAGLGFNCAGVMVDSERATITKTRFLVGDSDRTKQQVLRIDREPDGLVPEATRAALLRALEAALSQADAVLLSDYGYGLLEGGMLPRLEAMLRGLPVTVDSRYALTQHRGITLATPNLGEVEAVLGRRLSDQAAVEEAGQTLRERLGSRGLLVTQGNQGMTLFEEGASPRHIAVSGAQEVTDVSGAGDTVIAAATAAIAAGIDLYDAARLANLAAGVTVMKVGAATCNPDELRRAVEPEA